MALKSVAFTVALMQLASVQAVRVRIKGTEDMEATSSLGPDSEECKTCKQPCEQMEASDAETFEAWSDRVAKSRCFAKCVTGGAGMPVGPCREIRPVTAGDMFSNPRMITDSRQIFPLRANQVEWLGRLKGNGASYVQRGAWAFALKQINFDDHVIVLMFKESNARASQFIVDGPEYAGVLQAKLANNPSLFDAAKRPEGEGEHWQPEQPCNHENPAECCCYYQDRKFVTGYFYDRKYSGAGCTGQSIDNCGESLNPMPGTVWFSKDKTTNKLTKMDPWA